MTSRTTRKVQVYEEIALLLAAESPLAKIKEFSVQDLTPEDRKAVHELQELLDAMKIPQVAAST